MVFLKYFFEKADFENNQQLEEFSGARVNTITGQPRYLKVQGNGENISELSEVRHKQNVTSAQYDVHVQFLQDILLQYMCSKTVPTDNQIEMKTKEIHFSLFYFHFSYFVKRHKRHSLSQG